MSRTGPGQSWTARNIGRRILFGRLYLESAFMSLGSTARCAEATYHPATLLFTTPVAAYMSGRLTPMQGLLKIDGGNTELDAPFAGEPLVSGQQSKAIGGFTLNKQVTDFCGNTYVSDIEEYSDNTIYMRKVCQRWVPSSLYSGKLRLFVQSIYGSGRGDYAIYLNGFGLPDTTMYKLILGGYTLEHSLPTAGLLTTADYQYYLLSVSVSSVTFIKLKLSASALRLLEILQTHPNNSDRNFVDRVEGYALATAKIDDTFTPVVKSTGVSAVGSPLGYGFKFNWSGHEAKVILHELGPSGVNYSRTVTLTISDTLTVSGTVTAPKPWSNSATLAVFAPDWFEMKTVSVGEPSVGPANTTNCALYGFYDREGLWQEFTIDVDITYQTLSEAPPPLSNANFPGYGEQAPVNVDGTYTSCTNCPIGTVGYSFSGTTANFSYKAGLTVHSFSGGYVWCSYLGVPRLTVGDYYENYFPYTPAYYSPNTETFGSLAPHLVEAWPDPGSGYTDTQVIYYWYYSEAGNYWSINSRGGSNTVTTYNYIETYTWSSVAYNGFLRWNYESYTNLSEACDISCTVPFFDAEALVYGHSHDTSWSTKAHGMATHNLRLRALYAYLYGVLASYQYMHHGRWIQSEAQLAVKQEIANGQTTGYTLEDIVYDPAGGTNETVIKYAVSGSEGWTAATIDGYTLRAESKATPGRPAWADRYFLPPYGPNVAVRSSVGGANILLNDEGDGALENGYPAGTYSATGWV